MPKVKGKLGSRIFGKKIIGWLASEDPQKTQPRIASVSDSLDCPKNC